MKNSKRILGVILGIIFIFAMPAAVWADLYVESEVVTQGMPELPKGLPKQVLDQMKSQFESKKQITKTYYTDHAMRNESDDGIMIMDFNTMTMYHLDAAKKTATKTDMNEVFKRMGDMGMGDMNITPTGEAKKIAGYTCKKYIQTMPMGEIVHWVSKDVEGAEEIKALGKNMEKLVKKNPAFQQFSPIGSMGEMDGWPVQTIFDMMGVSTITTLKKIEKKSLDKDLFKVPKGYTVTKTEMPDFKNQ